MTVRRALLDKISVTRLRQIVVIAFALTVIFTKLAMIGWCAPLVPFWDEWPATATEILKPWYADQFHWSELWASHNGHRIALTRLWEITWFKILGQWDPTTTASVCALLVTVAESALVIRVARNWASRERILWFAANLLFLAVPYGYFNLLSSFQSQFHFFVILTVVAILAVSRLDDSFWWGLLAVFSSFLSLFSVGAGLFTAVAAAGLLIGRAVAARRLSPRSAITALCLIAVTVAGLTLTAGEPRPPVQKIAIAAARYTGWPISNFANLVADWPASARFFPPRVADWPQIALAAGFMNRHVVVIALLFGMIALVTYWPVGMLLVRAVRAGRQAPVEWWVLIGVAGWALLNALGMAVARTDDPLIPSRYQDLLLFGIVANAGALCTLPAGRLRTWTVAAWWLPTGTALLITALGIFAIRMPHEVKDSAVARHAVQNFAAGGEMKWLQNLPGNIMIKEKGDLELAQWLQDPGVQAILPADVRTPPADVTFVGGCMRFVLRLSTAIAVLACLVFVVSALLLWPINPAVPTSEPRDRSNPAIPLDSPSAHNGQ